MIGYGGTEAPRVPPASIELYSFKRAAEDIKELARQLGANKVILGGHDWVGPNHPSQIGVCVCVDVINHAYLRLFPGRCDSLSHRAVVS